jgi:hypothetical protein
MAPKLFQGKISCPKCGHNNRRDARFCANCGETLPESDAPKVEHHHWAKAPSDFAVRIETGDLKGLLRRGLIVEPGVNALIVHRGEVQGTVPPGTYTLEKAMDKAWDWLTTGISEQATALLVDVTPTDIDFHLGNRFTSDPLPIGVSIKMRVSVSEPGRFLVDVLKGGDRMSQDDLREFLMPEINQVTDLWLRKHTLQALVDEPRKRDELELAIEDALDRVFKQSGLSFDHIRTVELNLEPYDEIKGLRGDRQLLIYRSEAELGLEATEADVEVQRRKAQLDAQKRMTAIDEEFDLQALAEETRKVEQREQKVDLYQRMREVTLSDRMNEIRTERDFEDFMDELDFDKVLKEKEREELLQTWQEEQEDHEIARAHLLAKLDIEQDFEQRMTALELQSDLDEKALEAETRLARLRATKQEEIEFARWQFELKRRREDLAFDLEEIEQALKIARMEREEERLARQEAAEDEAEQMRTQIDLAREALQSMKDVRMNEARQQWELEKARLELDLVHQEKEAELEMAQERMQAEFELQRMDKLGDLGVEALISVSGEAQARVLADLKQTEAMQGMSEEQILALAAKDSPEVARAIAEKFKAVAAGQANEETTALYERLLAEKQTSMEAIQAEADKRVQETSGAWEKASAQSKESIERALDRMSDTAQAFAQGSGKDSTPVIVTSPGGSQVIQPGTTGSAPLTNMKVCRTCGRSVLENAKFCEHCGKKFEGMG